MRRQFTFDPAMVSDEYKKKTAHFGKYYHDLGFEVNENMTTAVMSTREASQNVPIGYLLIGTYRFEVKIKTVRFLTNTLEEAIFKVKLSQADTVETVINSQHFHFTHAELVKLKGIIVTSFDSYKKKLGFGLLR